MNAEVKFVEFFKSIARTAKCLQVVQRIISSKVTWCNMVDLQFPICSTTKTPVTVSRFDLRFDFFRRLAVDRRRGPYFYEWNIGLYVGNNPLWLEPYIKDLALKIREARERAGFRALKSIRISAPDQSDIVCSIDDSSG